MQWLKKLLHDDVLKAEPSRRSRRSLLEPTRRNGLRTALGVLVILLVLAPAGSASSAGTARTRTTPAVAVVGDSLVWQADASIESDLSHSGHAMRVWSTPGMHCHRQAQGELKEDLQEKRFGIIVIETAVERFLSGRGASESLHTYSELLASLLHAAAGRCVVVVNAKVDVTPFSYEPRVALAVNRVISQTARTHSNERVVTWNLEAEAHPLWFRSDLLHFTSMRPKTLLASDPPPTADQSAGDKAFARAIVAGIASCRDVQTSGTASG